MSWSDGTPYVEELVPGVYAYVQPDGGWMVNNAGVVVDGSGTSVVVDSSSTEARTRRLLDEVARVAPGTPRALVNTHHHPDHTYGNGFFPAATMVLGHDGCRDAVLQAGLEATEVVTGPDYGDLVLRPPDVTFPDRMTLHLQFPVELQHVGAPAHTGNDVLVWLPEQKALFAGDLAFNGGQPFVLEGSVLGFRDAIRRMRALEPEVLVPGHGPVCRGDDVLRLLEDMDRYLVFVHQIAADGHAAGLSPLQTAQQHRHNPYAGWAEPERLVGNLRRAYSELAGNPLDTVISVPSTWPDMVAFHGGPIASHA